MRYQTCRIWIGLLICTVSASLTAEVLPMRERAAFIDSVTEDRLSQVLPAIMRRENIDMWLLISREYNEDPVLETMLPATWLSARRRTMLVIYDPGQGQSLERLAVARYDVGNLFKQAWDKDASPDQYEALAALIRKRDPARIGINISTDFGLADGLSATEYKLLQQALGEKYSSRLVSAEYVAIGWLETRTSTERKKYEDLTRMGHKLIADAFSNKVVKPGVTTTADVEWWLRDATRAIKLTNWFHPAVSVQRPATGKSGNFSSLSGDTIIQPGDLLHVDFGLSYLRLHSDQQQHAYVLKPGEKDAPQELISALARANRLQDILTGNFKAGASGNEILKLSRAQAIAEGIKPTIYTHPVGYHGHGAGTTIGMWDAQQGLPVQGDYPLHPHTAYAIELNAAVEIPGWGNEIHIMLEEQAWFDGNNVRYIDDRQTRLHLIQSNSETAP